MNWRRSSYFVFFIIFFMAFASINFAQGTKKIGVIDSQKILENSEEGKRVIAQLQDREKVSQAELEKLDEAVRNLETRLNTQRLTLSEESIIQMTSDLERKRTDRKRYYEDTVRDFQELQIRLFNRVQNELLPIIQKLGKDMGYEVILDLNKSGAIYWDSAVDLTNEVIRLYNASKTGKK